MCSCKTNKSIYMDNNNVNYMRNPYIYLKSKHSFARLTMHHKANEATNEFVTNAHIRRRPPKSET